jgi:hypothetical protein
MTEQNSIYNLDDIQDKQLYDTYADTVAKRKGLDVNNPETTEKIKNTKIVNISKHDKIAIK